MDADLEQHVEMVRSIFRKDLTSVGFVPTGTAIQLVASDDPRLGMALMLEAVYVQIYNDRDLAALRAYLKGPLMIQPEMVDYIIKSAFRVRDALATNIGNVKAALADLMTDKGADEEMLKLLLTTCHNVSKEFKVPFDKRLKAEEEFIAARKVHPLSCVIMLVIVGLICYGLYAAIRWLFG